MGHTRWATHGGCTDNNSHPHTSNNKKITLVHNGIISNYKEIKDKYLFNYKFSSNTDTEVICNLLQYLQELYVNETFENIMEKTTNMLIGTWALIIYNKDEPDKIYFMKNENPLLISVNNEIAILTSEPSGFMNMVDEYILLRDKTYGYIFNNTYKIYGESKI